MALVLAAVSSCGGDDDSGSPAESETGVAQQVTKRVQRLDKVVPTAKAPKRPLLAYRTTRTVQNMDEFLTDVIQNIDAYWVRVFAESGIAEPQVTYNWLQPGDRVEMACQQPDGSSEVTSDATAAYCPADDTMYVSQQFSFDLWRGIVRGQQSQTYPGDFGVAYVVAHEYGHNVQSELGAARLAGEISKPYELQADCFAGTWANSSYYEGRLEGGDAEEAIGTANELGDLDFLNPDHHGTPEERADAWTRGYNSGAPNDCQF
jgi:uncharacterized protein